MLNRIHQFYQAISADMTDVELAYVKRRLEGKERDLFFSMGVMEQVHAYNVARTVENLLKKKEWVSLEPRREFLLRLALLHDVGKEKGDLNLLLKVMTVLLDEIMPFYAKKLAIKGELAPKGTLQHALYIYYHHAEIGARKLLEVGCNEEAFIIADHHKEDTEKDTLALKLLRLADQLN